MTDLSPETVGKLVALVHWMDGKRGQHADYYTRFGFEAWNRVRDLMPELPEPVDPDEAEAAEICALDAEAIGDLGLAAEYRAGNRHDSSWPRIALAAIKRGRALAAGDR